MHPKLVLDSKHDSLGLLCVNGSKSYREFSKMLDDIVQDFVEEHANEHSTSEEQSFSMFKVELNGSPWAAELKWLESTLNEVDHLFDACFEFRNASYLWHFSRSQNAVQASKIDAFFEAGFARLDAPNMFGEEAFENPESMIRKVLSLGVVYGDTEHLTALKSLFECTGTHFRNLSLVNHQSNKLNGHDLLVKGRLGGIEGDLNTAKSEVQSLERRITQLNRRLKTLTGEDQNSTQQQINEAQEKLEVLAPQVAQIELNASAARRILDEEIDSLLANAPHRNFRRSFAASYRMARILDMTKTDANINSLRDQQQRRDKEELSTRLAGLMGNCADEEDLFKTCTRIAYPRHTKTAEGEVFVPCPVRHFYSSQMPADGAMPAMVSPCCLSV